MFTWVLGIELGSLYLQGRQFTHYAILHYIFRIQLKVLLKKILLNYKYVVK